MIVGFDPSLTAFGVAGWGGREVSGPADVVVIRSKLRGVRRMIELRDEVLSAVPARGRVVMEGFAFTQDKSAHDAGGLGWVVRVALFEAGVPCLVVTPNQLKKFATGKGNAKKSHVVSSVSVRTGMVFESDDAVDALVLYCMGRELDGLPHPLGLLPQSHRDAIAELEWSQAVGWESFGAVAGPG